MENETPIKEIDQLPPDPVTPDPAQEAAERARQLEIDKARLEGQLEAMRAPVPATGNTDQWKATVWTELSSLSDDEFATKYRVPKHQASAALLQQEFQTTSVQNRQQIAELRAENQLASKYPDFFSHQDQVRDALADAAPDVRQDPARLAKFMERAYLALPKGEGKSKPAAKAKEDPARRVVSSFEPPAPPESGNRDAKKDEIPDEFRGLARQFGLTSEAERKALMKNEFCRMELGGGVVFEDPDRGFERKAAS